MTKEGHGRWRVRTVRGPGAVAPARRARLKGLKSHRPAGQASAVPRLTPPPAKCSWGPSRALPQGSLGFPRGSAAACSALRPSCPSTSGLTRPAGHAHSGQSAPRPRSRPAHGRPRRERHCVPSGEVCSSRPTLGAGGLTLHVCTHRPTEPEHARPCEPRVCSLERTAPHRPGSGAVATLSTSSTRKLTQRLSTPPNSHGQRSAAAGDT